MEYNKINYFEKTDKPQHREFIISQNNCILCGTVLELKHITDRKGLNLTVKAGEVHKSKKNKAPFS